MEAVDNGEAVVLDHEEEEEGEEEREKREEERQRQMSPSPWHHSEVGGRRMHAAISGGRQPSSTLIRFTNGVCSSYSAFVLHGFQAMSFEIFKNTTFLNLYT